MQHEDNFVEDGIPNEEDLFGRLKEVIRPLLNHRGNKVYFGKVRYNKVLPSNMTLHSQHKKQQIACVAVCNAHGSALSSRIKNIMTTCDKVLLVRDERCSSPGPKTKQLLQKLNQSDSFYLSLGAEEYSQLYAIYDVLVAVQEQELQIEEVPIQEAEYFKVLLHQQEFLRGELFPTLFQWVDAQEPTPPTGSREKEAPKEKADEARPSPSPTSPPPAQTAMLRDVAAAVREEYHHSIQLKYLKCSQVSPVPGVENIYTLQLSTSFSFDWTWEGSVVFQPPPHHQDDLHSYAQQLTSCLWWGEILEVDQQKKQIHIFIRDPESSPQCGGVYVRPFEFLAHLDMLYNDERCTPLHTKLPLRRCLGYDYKRLQPGPSHFSYECFRPIWPFAWSVLWGPPGTGKTYAIGEQIAHLIPRSNERILVLSTTNQATDEVALSIGRAIQKYHPHIPLQKRVIRLGKSVRYRRFTEHSMDALLEGSETEVLQELETLTKQLSQERKESKRLALKLEVKKLRGKLQSNSLTVVMDPSYQVVVTTVFNASTLLRHKLLRDAIENDQAPFRTVILDEAGIVSRATTAALALLSSQRMVLVGDPKQLSPITKVSRVLPSHQAVWLAESGLGHLHHTKPNQEGIFMLRQQHRMHPDIRKVISTYQYHNQLEDAESVQTQRTQPLRLLQEQPRAIWYVLDEDIRDPVLLRAERGEGNRSWCRAGTLNVLRKIFTAHPEFLRTQGLFLSPFVAQVRKVQTFLEDNGYSHNWRAATIHSQQGAEASIVFFDTVNAGSQAWPYDEWMRLVNVGLSRARDFVFFLASRQEMEEPYLKTLQSLLAPRYLRQKGRQSAWTRVFASRIYEPPPELRGDKGSLGYQLRARRALIPILSAEQERICQYDMDGRPRLVRGVAGSGKTIVLAHWLCQYLLKQEKRWQDPAFSVWVMFANRSLHHLLQASIQHAWNRVGVGKTYPTRRVKVIHIRDLLKAVRAEKSLREPKGTKGDAHFFAYNDISLTFLHQMSARSQRLQPRCNALFVDEAQDMGPHTLDLLSKLVHLEDSSDSKSRPVMIFYDNAQNIYARPTPKWSEMGLEMRGRSTVMKESFRSTRAITELAYNVFCQLHPSANTENDHKELLQRGLVEPVQRIDKPWWKVHFNRVAGPLPTLQTFSKLDQQMEAISQQLLLWLQKEGVSPQDIKILAMTKRVRSALQRKVASVLHPIGINVLEQNSETFSNDPQTIVVTTPHSYKGYDSEIVLLAGLDSFVSKEQGVLPHALYVGMTRARSILAMFGNHRDNNPESNHLLSVVQGCLEQLQSETVDVILEE